MRVTLHPPTVEKQINCRFPPQPEGVQKKAWRGSLRVDDGAQVLGTHVLLQTTTLSLPIILTRDKIDEIR
jgi:hypothetical protein